MTAKEWDGLILHAAQDEVDELPAHIRRNELPILSALDDAVQAAEDQKASDLFQRLLKSRVFANPMGDSSHTTSSRQCQSPILPKQSENELFTNTFDATGHKRYKLHTRDCLASRTKHGNELALRTAVSWGYLEAVQTLIRADLTVKSCSRDQIHALLDAVKNGNLETVHELLFSQIVLYHVKLSSALYLAGKCGHSEIGKFLLGRVAFG